MTLERGILEASWRLLESGLTDETSGNVSARCTDGTMLITPSGRDCRFLTERDIIRVHLDSERAEGKWKPSSEWRLHAAIYRARHDVAAIIHHHATWASAVAVARKTIPVLVDEAADVGPIPTAPYAPSASQQLADVTSATLIKGRNAVLLANHGAVVVGRDLREALRRARQVERLAKIYIGAELLGGAKVLDEAEVTRSRSFFETYRAPIAESLEPISLIHRFAGPVGLGDLANYSFRASVTFAALVHALILRKLRL